MATWPTPRLAAELGSHTQPGRQTDGQTDMCGAAVPGVTLLLCQALLGVFSASISQLPFELTCKRPTSSRSFE